MTALTPIVSSTMVTHALEGLDPELRSIFMSHKDTGSQEVPVTDKDGIESNNEDLKIVTQCVRHVMSQALSGTKQQEAAIRAAQQLEATAQRLDQELHTEVITRLYQEKALISQGKWKEVVVGSLLPFSILWTISTRKFNC